MKRTIPVILIALGALLLAGSGWLLFGTRGVGNPGDLLPSSVAGLPLTSKTTGEEAVSQVADLHGRQFPIVMASIGQYGSQQITLWIAGSESESGAAAMVDAMQTRIAKGNSPFTPQEQYRQDGRTVFVLEGMGQQHYYFQSKNLVIWLAADPALAEQSIQQLLEAYP
jgi:hypothetical protein